MTALSTIANNRKLVDLSVLMPFFNHGANLAENVKTTLADLNSLLQLSYELIVVDDGSTDATYQEACRIASANPRVSVLRSDSNSGKGAALRMGFAASRGGLICFLDGDLQISARHIPRFIEYMRLESVDVVVASKRHPLSVVDYPRTRRILSRSYQLLISALFGIPLTDTQTGLKLFRREVLERIFPRALVKRYAFDVELLANVHRLGYRIVEAPIEIARQKSYNSHVDLAAVRRMFRDTLGIFYRMYIRHHYDRAGRPTPRARRVAVLGRESERRALMQYLASKGVEPRFLPVAGIASGDVALRRLGEEAFDLAFVCLGEPENAVPVRDEDRLHPYLDVLGRMLVSAGGYRCVVFSGWLPPGMTRHTIVPYLERATQKRVEEDFDVVVLPSVEELSQIEPRSPNPDPLLVGFTGLRAISALSPILKELEPIMMRTDPSTAEAAHHVQHLVRANAQPLAQEILNACLAAGADTERILDAFGIWKNGKALSPRSGES